MITLVLATVMAIHPIEHCKGASKTSEVNECGQKYLAESEAYLNSTYKRVLSGLSPTERSELVQAQRSWIQYRQHSCIFEQHFTAGEGTMGTQIYLGCMYGMADERAEALASFLKRP